jgi:hypothetical protein
MRAESISSIGSIDRTNPTMAISPSAHLPTTPNAHPVAIMHLGNGVEVAAAAQQAYLPPDVTAPRKFVASHDITEMECPSIISNCNAEEGDERGTTERDPEMPSESNATKKDTTEVICVHFYHSN